MHLRSIFLGTIDFVGERIPDVIGWFLGRVSSRISKSMPTGVLISRKAPLFLRRGHVPSELEFVTLEDTNKAKQTRFVVHYHEAERAGNHFDLRFVYRRRAVSWAIPMKGKRDGFNRFPRPGERWLAVRQPDHNLKYMDFEGEIPSGLGKGKVTIWDKGHLDILKIKDGHVHLRALEGKIRGDWVIVNTGKKQSLIIAKTPISIASWTKPSYNRKVVEKLKDLQRDPNLRIETKLDGAALEIRVGAEYSTISSHRISKRTGTTIDHSDRIVGIRGIKSPELDGTVLRVEGFHPEGVEFLAGTLNSGVIKARLLQKQHGPIRTAVFDILKYKGQDVSHLPYQQRRALYESVCRQLKSKLVRPVDQAGPGTDWTSFYRKQVFREDVPTDGAIIKDITKGYNEVPWIKVKPHETADLEVVGFTEGDNRLTESLGSIIVQDGDKHIHVGSGFTDAQRRWIWEHREDLLGEVARVDFHVRSGERTSTGPRFDSWHPDKSEAALEMYAENL